MFLFSLNGIAQEFADKEYYLIDSLKWEELSAGDKALIDSCLNVYHKATEDSIRINSLTDVCENMVHEDWKKYQFFQYNLISEVLKTNPSEKKRRSILYSYAQALNNIGYIHRKTGNFPLALTFYAKSLDVNTELNDKKSITITYNNMAMVYFNQGNIPLALDLYHKNLKVFEELKDEKSKSIILNNIGLIHQQQRSSALALDYFHKSLEIKTKFQDKNGMANSYSNIGITHRQDKNYEEALHFFEKSLSLKEELKDQWGIANSYNYLGSIYYNQEKYPEALSFSLKSLKIREVIKDKEGIANSCFNIGFIYFKQQNLEQAKIYGERSLAIAKEIGSPADIKDATQLLSLAYEKQGKGLKALDMFKFHIQMRDSVNNEETQKATAKQQAKYEYEKQKVLDDAEHDKQLAIEQEEKEKQQILTAATAGGLGLVAVFLIFVFNRLRVTKKQKLVIEEQKVEVEQQKEVVEQAHHELEEKNQEIMDSIAYAKRIQSAILPPAKLVKEYLKESFILYKPKDVVAGDFYWMEHKDEKVLFAAADCTGHGVPGAMVSVVCNNALNRSVREHGLTDPGEILTKTREIVIQEFEKSEEEVKDGMDIALCSLTGNKLQYAGAHNPLWIIRNGEILETKANKQPIGQFDNPEPYTTHTFDLEPGDTFYVFSDGYVDQFGGEKGKKFKARAFRELLLSIQDKAMEEQKVIIDEAFETWRGDLEQIDDVCVVGVRV